MLRRAVGVKVLVLVLVGLLLVTGCGGQTPVASNANVTGSSAALQGTNVPTPRTINVSGSGLVTGTPDIAYVTVGVDIQDPSPSAASAENTRRMNAIMGVIRAAGIEDRDVRTTNFSIYLERKIGPRGEDTGEQVYHVVNQVRVTVRDLSKVGSLLEQAVAAGANSVGSIAFSVADPAALQRQARDQAIADAKARAQQLASGLGVQVGAVQSVTEMGGETPRPAAVYADRTLAQGAPDVPISGGEISVSIQLSVSFLIE